MRTALRAGAAALVVVVAALLVAGWRPVVLLSDSMAPGAPAGSLLVARPVAPESVAVDDVVTVELEGAGRVTHRVVAVEELEGRTWARLQGDANPLPDPGRVELADPTLRTVAVVPVVGRAVAGGSPLLLAGLGLLAIGIGGLALVDRRDADEARPGGGPHGAAAPGGPAPAAVDPRVIALAATLEALDEAGMDRATLVALGRVRTAALLGLGDAERSPAAASLDDGARFVLVALADADVAALASVPPAAARAVAARDAVDDWWAGLSDRVPGPVRAELAGVPLDDVDGGGIVGAGPVD